MPKKRTSRPSAFELHALAGSERAPTVTAVTAETFIAAAIAADGPLAALPVVRTGNSLIIPAGSRVAAVKLAAEHGLHVKHDHPYSDRYSAHVQAPGEGQIIHLATPQVPAEHIAIAIADVLLAQGEFEHPFADRLIDAAMTLLENAPYGTDPVASAPEAPLLALLLAGCIPTYTGHLGVSVSTGVHNALLEPELVDVARAEHRLAQSPVSTRTARTTPARVHASTDPVNARER